MHIEKGSLIVLVDNIHDSLITRNNKYIPAGTEGKVIATRKLSSDTEKMLLVKFNGVGGHRHVNLSWVKLK